MNSPLRFSIIGCGKIAPRHASEIVKHGTLVAVCDVMKDRADDMARRFDVVPFYSIEDVFNHQQIDIAAICTPNGLHARHSILALEAGAHVLCEKPMCITSADGGLMMEAAAKAGRKLFVVKSTRYNPALISLKEALEAGRLGKVYSFQLNCFWNRPAAYYADTWKGSLDLDGGTLFTQFSHYIDALIWLLGDLEVVSGLRHNFAHQDTIDFEDTGIAAVRMKSGVIGGINWSVNTYEKNMEVSLSLIAEKGCVEIGGEYMNSVKYEGGALHLNVSAAGSPNDYGFYKGSMSNHHRIYENLIKTLSDETHPFTNAVDGLRTVEAIEKIYKSVSLS
jgi:predicted dehydrogenase